MFSFMTGIFQYIFNWIKNLIRWDRGNILQDDETRKIMENLLSDEDRKKIADNRLEKFQKAHQDKIEKNQKKRKDDIAKTATAKENSYYELLVRDWIS